MATLQDLTQSTLMDLLHQDPKALEDALYNSSAADINRQSGDTARAINEGTFARGMGLSTIVRDLQATREQTRDEALVKARRDSMMASRSATLAALAQAAGQQAQRQQAGQFEANYGLQKKALHNQENAQHNAMIAQGVGGIGGAALTTGGLVYGPEIKSALHRLMGTVPAGQQRVTGEVGGPASPPTSLDQLASEPPASAMPDFSGGGDLSVPDFQLPDASSFSLPDTGFDPGQFSLGDLNFGGSALDWLARSNASDGLGF